VAVLMSRAQLVTATITTRLSWSHPTCYTLSTFIWTAMTASHDYHLQLCQAGSPHVTASFDQEATAVLMSCIAVFKA
jgi:hypothetical protein